MRPCVSDNISRASSRIFSATPLFSLPDGRLKRGKYKKSAVGGKKSPASPVQKRDYLINHISLVIQPTIINPLLPK